MHIDPELFADVQLAAKRAGRSVESQAEVSIRLGKATEAALTGDTLLALLAAHRRKRGKQESRK